MPKHKAMSTEEWIRSASTQKRKKTATKPLVEGPMSTEDWIRQAAEHELAESEPTMTQHGAGGLSTTSDKLATSSLLKHLETVKNTKAKATEAKETLPAGVTEQKGIYYKDGEPIGEKGLEIPLVSPTDLATLPAGVGAKVAVKVGGKIMYALPDAAVPAAIGAANRATEIVSTGYGNAMRGTKSAVGFALRNQKKIEQGLDATIGWFDPTPGATTPGQIGGAASYYFDKFKERY